MDRALTVVKEGYGTFIENNPKATKAEIANWANNARDIACGEGFYETPASGKVCAPARQRFQAALLTRLARAP